MKARRVFINTDDWWKNIHLQRFDTDTWHLIYVTDRCPAKEKYKDEKNRKFIGTHACRHTHTQTHIKKKLPKNIYSTVQYNKYQKFEEKYRKGLSD